MIAHDKALALFGSTKVALQTQYAMLALMVPSRSVGCGCSRAADRHGGRLRALARPTSRSPRRPLREPGPLDPAISVEYGSRRIPASDRRRRRPEGPGLPRVSDWSGDELLTAHSTWPTSSSGRTRTGEEHAPPARANARDDLPEAVDADARLVRGRHQRSSAGSGLYLSAADLQLGRGETVKDTAHVLSRYLDAIMIRTFCPGRRRRAGPANSTIPVINGLTDSSHPCQALADVMTIRERLGRLDGVQRGVSSATATTSAPRS